MLNILYRAINKAVTYQETLFKDNASKTMEKLCIQFKNMTQSMEMPVIQQQNPDDHLHKPRVL